MLLAKLSSSNNVSYRSSIWLVRKRGISCSSRKLVCLKIPLSAPPAPSSSLSLWRADSRIKKEPPIGIRPLTRRLVAKKKNSNEHLLFEDNKVKGGLVSGRQAAGASILKSNKSNKASVSLFDFNDVDYNHQHERQLISSSSSSSISTLQKKRSSHAPLLYNQAICVNHKKGLLQRSLSPPTSTLANKLKKGKKEEEPLLLLLSSSSQAAAAAATTTTEITCDGMLNETVAGEEQAQNKQQLMALYRYRKPISGGVNFRRCLHSSAKVASHHKSSDSKKPNDQSSSIERDVKDLRRNKPGLVLGRHVKEALLNGEPVVALESTVITHGLPEPQNLQLALTLERIVSTSKNPFYNNNELALANLDNLNDIENEYVRAHEGRKSNNNDYEKNLDINRYNIGGFENKFANVCTPATIGIVKGQVVVGLSWDEIKYLADKKLSKPIKASRRDVPIAMALGLSAGTTVSATMAIANSVRLSSLKGLLSSKATYNRSFGPEEGGLIKVFATGGTGGVHLGGELSMDVSADLYEFARSPIGVVSSGFKSFLDTRRSLEFLETMGCPVVSLAISSSYNDDDDDDDNGTQLIRSERKQDCSCYNEGNKTSSSSSFFEAREKYKKNENGKLKAYNINTHHNSNYLFPAFFTRTNSQNIKSPRIVNSIEEAAKILFYCLEAAPLDNRRAMLIANPIPKEFSLDSFCSTNEKMEKRFFSSRDNNNLNGRPDSGSFKLYCENNDGDDEKKDKKFLSKEKRQMTNTMTLEEAITNISNEIDKRLDLEGKDKTPLILERLNSVTGGKTLKANIELLKYNAQVGAQLALEYSKQSNAFSSSSILNDSPIETGTNVKREAVMDDSIRSTTTTTSLSSSSSSFTKSVGISTSAEWEPALVNNERMDMNEPCNNSSLKGGNEDERGNAEASRGPVVVGCTMIDMHVSTKIDDHFKNNPKHSGITFTGRPHLTLGGVGRNLACAIEFLGHRPTFITSLGNDNLASFAMNEFHRNGLTLESRRLRISTLNENGSGKERTDSSCCFALVLVDSITGLSEYVIANLDAIEAIDRKFIDTNMDSISNAPLVVMDANLKNETMEYLIEVCHKYGVPIFLEPTDKLALPRLVDSISRIKDDNNNPDCLHSILCLSPNLIELTTMIGLFEQAANKDQINSNYHNIEEDTSIKDQESYLSVEEVQRMAKLLMDTYLPQLRCLLVTMDKRGVLVGIRTKKRIEEVNGQSENTIEGVKLMNENLLIKESSLADTTLANDTLLYFKHFPTPTLIDRPISGSGAGDSFAAGFISGLLANSSLIGCLNKGFKASLLTLNDKENISPKLKGLA